MGVNVTDVPVQIVVAVAVILNDGVMLGLTTMVIEFEVAVGTDAQPILDVIIHVITSAFAKVALAYVAPVPAFTPFTFH